MSETKSVAKATADAATQVQLYSIDRVVSKLNLGGWDTTRTLKTWIDDPEIVTPTVLFNMWDENSLVDWKALWDKQTEAARALESERLNSETMKKVSMIEHLVTLSQELAKANSRAYSHNRGNSLADGRMRVLEFNGAYSFARKMLGDLKIPNEKRLEIEENLAKAKASVKMR